MVLVLGGAGYIGSHAVRALIKEGKSVVVVDSLETGHREAVPSDVPFHVLDIRDTVALEGVFKQYEIEAVMHFCANSLVGESVKDPLKYFDNNVGGAISLLKVMKAHHVDKIIFSSTAAVYGDVLESPITENIVLAPTSPYGESKRMMEQLFKWADEAYGIKYVSLRYFNVAGAASDGTLGEAHKVETHLIPLVLQVPLGQRPHITLFGEDYPTPDGTCIRDYIHVEDLVEAHILALAYLFGGNQSDIFNLGIGQGFSVKEVVACAAEVTGGEIPVVMGARRAGDPTRLVASAEKAQKALNWVPKRTKLKAIVEDAWRFHSNHPNGYKEEK